MPGGKRRTKATSSASRVKKKVKPASSSMRELTVSSSDQHLVSTQEERLAKQLVEQGMGGFTRQFQFHEKRRWKSDFAWPDLMLLLEYDGITGCRRSRHTTVKGFTGDCEKLNEAAILGWTVIRVTAPLMRDGTGMDQIRRAYETRRELA